MNQERPSFEGTEPGPEVVEPIAVALQVLATSHRLPVAELDVCTARIAEAGPALRAVLARAAAGEALTEDESVLAFRGLHVLAAARDVATYRPLLTLLRQPPDALEELLGDAITATLARIVASVFDGEAEGLFGLIADATIDEFVRNSLFGAAAFLTWQGRIEIEPMTRFLVRFHDERLAENADFAWNGWQQAIALLGLRSLAPLVTRAFRERRISQYWLRPADFEHDLAASERAPADRSRFDDAHLGILESASESLGWVDHADEGAPTPSRPSPWDDEADPVNTPAVNPWRDVGRNDPCPCGSGKKAKKCCMPAWQRGEALVPGER